MTYHRVIPRDLFNEAKLLKCLGRLALLIHDNHPVTVKYDMEMELKEPQEGFTAYQQADGGLYVGNVAFYIRGEQCPLWTAYNNRDNYPLWCEVHDGTDHVLVFDEDGNFHPDFIAALEAP